MPLVPGQGVLWRRRKYGLPENTYPGVAPVNNKYFVGIINKYVGWEGKSAFPPPKLGKIKKKLAFPVKHHNIAFVLIHNVYQTFSINCKAYRKAELTFVFSPFAKLQDLLPGSVIFCHPAFYRTQSIDAPFSVNLDITHHSRVVPDNLSVELQLRTKEKHTAVGPVYDIDVVSGIHRNPAREKGIRFGNFGKIKRFDRPLSCVNYQDRLLCRIDYDEFAIAGPHKTCRAIQTLSRLQGIKIFELGIVRKNPLVGRIAYIQPLTVLIKKNPANQSKPTHSLIARERRDNTEGIRFAGGIHRHDQKKQKVDNKKIFQASFIRDKKQVTLLQADHLPPFTLVDLPKGMLFRARSKITSHFDAPIHPAWLCCSSVK
jgi:hypothetical protein